MKVEYNNDTLKIILPLLDGIPEIELKLVSAPIVARTRKLRARWTPELAQELTSWNDIHGMDYWGQG